MLYFTGQHRVEFFVYYAVSVFNTQPCFSVEALLLIEYIENTCCKVAPDDF